ncbi:MAG: hypothetical protein CVV49_00135 [Spirochaetae bacterium HGW-Spirochaetae-5]|nr:MAG: hypothetical protein CVV49_00135 [Spirochaetae bacterium HGW-Spirochaetae-5]
MRILVACEYSGAVRDEFKKLGHYVLSCDLLPTEKPGLHYQGDVMDIINDKWDMMIAFPPCTHLAVSGAAHFKNKIEQQKEAISFVKKLWDCNIPKIAIENPVGVLSTKFKKPDQIIQPYFFGDNYSKKTCLWLKNLPFLNWFPEGGLFPSSEVIPEYLFYNSKKTKSGLSKYSKFGKLGKGKGKERSLFPPGISKAMAEQWGN